MLLKQDKRIIFFDTETTGVKPGEDRIVQLAYIVGTYNGEEFEIENKVSVIINPQREIPKEASDIHGITDDMVQDKPFFKEYAGDFMRELTKADIVVGHNISFDIGIVGGEVSLIWEDESKRESWKKQVEKKCMCTMKQTVDLCKIPHPKGWKSYKWPKLIELHQFLFKEGFDGAHDALADIEATKRCFLELHKRAHITII